MSNRLSNDARPSTDFKTHIVKICNDLSSDDIRKLKFLCSDFISVSKLEECKLPQQLFERLYMSGCLSDTDTTIVYNLLACIKRKDLIKKLPPVNERHECKINPFRLVD